MFAVALGALPALGCTETPTEPDITVERSFCADAENILSLEGVDVEDGYTVLEERVAAQIHPDLTLHATTGDWEVAGFNASQADLRRAIEWEGEGPQPALDALVAYREGVGMLAEDKLFYKPNEGIIEMFLATAEDGTHKLVQNGVSRFTGMLGDTVVDTALSAYAQGTFTDLPSCD